MAIAEPAYIDASDLGWRPGQWPYSLVYADMHFHFKEMHRDREGDVIYVEYRSHEGHELRVVND